MLMPEAERLETLQALQASREEAKAAMQRLPLLIETLGQKKRKEALDNKMKELEDAIKIFTRPKVYVQDDR